MTTDSQDIPTDIGGEDSYTAMFAAYCQENTWVKAAPAPIVFHVRRMCTVLDRQGHDPTGPMTSAYLQSLTRLERYNPGTPPDPEGGAGVPGQTSIFDTME